MNVVILGRPGAGKGTQLKRVAAWRGLQYLSTGDLFRSEKQRHTSLGRQIAQRIHAGHFVPDELAISLVEPAMSPPSQGGYVFDGIPRTVRQHGMLSDLLKSLGAKIDFVILLDVDEEKVRGRLRKRAEVEGRCDDNLETIGHRLAVDECESIALVDFYRQHRLLRSIDGCGTPEQVFEPVLATLDETTPGGAG